MYSNADAPTLAHDRSSPQLAIYVCVIAEVLVTLPSVVRASRGSICRPRRVIDRVTRAPGHVTERR